MFLPKEMIDQIFIDLPVQISIACNNTYTKRRLLSSKILESLWSRAVDEKDLATWLLTNEVKGFTPRTFYSAIRYGEHEVVKYIIKNTGSSWFQNKEFENCGSPLILSLSFGHMDIAQLLLDNNFNIDHHDLAHDTALLACFSQSFGTACVLFLLKNGANPNVKDHYGRYPIHRAASSIIHSETNIMALLRYGADINAKDTTGNTLLHYYFPDGFYEGRCDNDSVFEMFMKYNLQINMRNDQGQTALHRFASMYPNDVNTRFMKNMIKNGADVNVQDVNNDTPLHLAVKSAFFDSTIIPHQYRQLADLSTSRYIKINDSVISLLLQNGASVAIVNNSRNTPVDNLVQMFQYFYKIFTIVNFDEFEKSMKKIVRLFYEKRY